MFWDEALRHTGGGFAIRMIQVGDLVIAAVSDVWQQLGRRSEKGEGRKEEGGRVLWAAREDAVEVWHSAAL